MNALTYWERKINAFLHIHVIIFFLFTNFSHVVRQIPNNENTNLIYHAQCPSYLKERFQVIYFLVYDQKRQLLELM